MTPFIQRERLAALLAAGRHQHVVIVGDAMLDVYLRGDVDRISPEAPVPVVRVRDRKLALGGAANVAQNVAALGAGCDLVAVVGNDRAGATLRERLDAGAMESRSLVTVSRPTTTKTRVMARSQQLVRFDEEDDADLAPEEVSRVLAAIEHALPHATALVLEDYNKGVLVPAVIAGAIALARARKLPVVVDPKFRNFFAYRGATVFKPNRRELESALGAAVDLDHPAALPDTFARLGVEHLLLTLGERGMALVSADGVVHRVPTTAREVYDVVGAGDTVTAYLATMLAAGASTLEAAVVANYAAGVEVGKLGAATVTPDEVLEAFDALHGLP
ncbi:MAG: D-glycero-beta-D-manno-heptose-7-phosphate kinase [Gemmatimonas sp.]|jgi:rfaE bifunctional protein kinase chain/domain|uniref:D-glycero-beta-D-manno-heptose-7-phosphate kinase n=1 Tax=Gemmatimonas sp. TaxID=1962908 RepID=UPI0022C4732A|nr:D-glycero-beta-D-manno-heptose-7-phosphate kinase [Gemmatimonas sp.]MCA2985194.1 D-glycero-beta-D-manno-heptose-7-phosphate kinase [Gemmatimonas sp.]MCA2986901.1 D-glycero-beta-D-manno-heptose-7-phosphate kinase [Gemmatimonas sp.]MCA2994042.1 D-glycero-beta-D-manno-heptose-7-phosphate kinase [Gemmatimonas sp.]MCE2953951.1 D-glycero-beta-D-manno-heptose-7-phosphate kinase [Gemmatimonas sp.]MCZ8013215.1 D-glycero-beta-D-manno-heptose-7-phosphate kinase [Gemmatimonas sp.]